MFNRTLLTASKILKAGKSTSSKVKGFHKQLLNVQPYYSCLSTTSLQFSTLYVKCIKNDNIDEGIGIWKDFARDTNFIKNYHRCVLKIIDCINDRELQAKYISTIDPHVWYTIIANNLTQTNSHINDIQDLETHQISPELLRTIIESNPRTKAWDDYIVNCLIRNDHIDHMEQTIDLLELNITSDNNVQKLIKWINYDFPSVTTEDLLEMFKMGRGDVAHLFKDEWNSYIDVFELFKSLETERLLQISME